jgi:hypothetical protein
VKKSSASPASKKKQQKFQKNAFQLQSLPDDWKQQVSYYQELEAQQEIVTGNMKRVRGQVAENLALDSVVEALDKMEAEELERERKQSRSSRTSSTSAAIEAAAAASASEGSASIQEVRASGEEGEEEETEEE